MSIGWRSVDAHNNGDCLSFCPICDLEDARKYECRSCGRLVDPDDESSPGEPTHCADCHWRNEKEADW